MIVCIDLETTGLNPNRDAIIEVAVIITDDNFQEVARYQRVIYHEHARALAGLDPDDVEGAARALGIDPVVIAMHAKNGLWAESATSEHELRQVDAELAALVQDKAVRVIGGRMDKPQLLGSSVHFDARFMARHMPETHARLHYRQIDVTTVNELARRFWPAAHAGRPSGANHRAMTDIEVSLATARYYAQALAPAAPPTTTAEQIAEWLYTQPTLSTDGAITGILRGDWRTP